VTETTLLAVLDGRHNDGDTVTVHGAITSTRRLNGQHQVLLSTIDAADWLVCETGPAPHPGPVTVIGRVSDHDSGTTLVVTGVRHASMPSASGGAS
jgi:hypothetical protein